MLCRGYNFGSEETIFDRKKGEFGIINQEFQG